MQIILQNKNLKQGALAAPAYPENIPAGAKWLGGEGYGVWFHISKPESLTKHEYRIRRYSEKGKLHCDRIFTHDKKQAFMMDQEFEFAYISHCEQCIVLQNELVFIFKSIKNYEE